MPVALLLQRVVGVPAAAAAALTPWLEIARLERTVVDRARGMFLVRWFGSRLPFEGLLLRVRIANLSARWDRIATVPAAGEPAGPNLTGPLLGTAGALTGLLISPLGATIGTLLLLRIAGTSVDVLLSAVGWLVASLALVAAGLFAPRPTGLLTGAGLVTGGTGFALVTAIGDRGWYDLLGAVARLMAAGDAFLDQLTGPRAAVRNPLLGRLRDLVAPVAALLAQLLGVAAVVVTKVAPVLPWVVEVANGIRDTAVATGEAIRAAGSGLHTDLSTVLTGQSGLAPLLGRLATTGRSQLARAVGTVLAQLDLVAATFATLWSALATRFDGFLRSLAGFVRAWFVGHPVGRVIDAFHTQVTLTAKVLRTPAGTTATTQPGSFADLVASLPVLPAIRDLPRWPAVPGWPGVRALAGTGSDLPDLGAVLAEADRLARVCDPELPTPLGRAAALATLAPHPNLVATERRDLTLLLGADPHQATRHNQAAWQQLHDAVAVVVRRFFPPVLRAPLVPVTGEPATDAPGHGTAAPTAAPEPFPVLDTAPEPVRPVVHTLRLRLPPWWGAAGDRFAEALTTRLAAEAYDVGR